MEKYRLRANVSPFPTWRAFLDNRVRELVSIGFFVVPTVKLQILFFLIVRAHERRRIVHFNGGDGRARLNPKQCGHGHYPALGSPAEQSARHR